MKHLTHWGFYVCTLAPSTAVTHMHSIGGVVYAVRHLDVLQDEALCPQCVVFASFCAANKWAGSALFTRHSRVMRAAPSKQRTERLWLARLKTLQHIRARLERGG